MKRITLVLKTSEVMSVRKAASTAGADRIVAHAISHRESFSFSNPQVPREDELVQLDVMVAESLSDQVISAILSTARLGKIEKISRVHTKHTTPNLHLLAA